MKKRLAYRGRRSARHLAKIFGASGATMSRIIKEDLHLHCYRVLTQPKLTNDHKKKRISFAYWVRKSLRKKDRDQILFTDEKYFSLEGVFNHQNECVYAVSREEADEQEGVRGQAKYPRKIMVWLGASKHGLTSPIIFKPRETLSHINYINVVLPHAQSEGVRLLGDYFIFQQDNATPHTHHASLQWCEENFTDFIESHKWPPNSPDLNVLDYYVWNAIASNMNWSKVKRLQFINYRN